jgi:hypothetical protein
MLKAIVICLILIGLTGAVNYPLGYCYEGCKTLMPDYPGAKIAYWEPSDESPAGHVCLQLVNGTILDSHYGLLKRWQYTTPDKIFESYSELDNYITIKI